MLRFDSAALFSMIVHHDLCAGRNEKLLCNGCKVRTFAEMFTVIDGEYPAMTVPPHWMIMWVLDPKATGLPTTYRDTGAYIMRAGSPYGSKQQRSALWM